MKRYFGIFMVFLMVLSMVVTPVNISAATESPYQNYIYNINSVSNFQGNNAIALQDVTGDSFPEMIYVTKGKEGSYAFCTIHVKQVYDDGYREILLETADFGPQEKGSSILEIFAAKDYLVIGTGCGDADENEYPVKREYTWYRFNGTEMKKSEVLGYLIPQKDKRGSSFYYGENETAKAAITDARYRSYLEAKIKNVFKTKGPIVSMSGKDGCLISTDMDRGMSYTETLQKLTSTTGLNTIYPRFLDVSRNSWYYSAVDYAEEKGLMTGTYKYMFSPGQFVSRAQVVTVLHRLEGSPYEYGNSFSDVKNTDWFYDAVKWASKNDITNGTTSTTFSPNDPVTREQLAAILYRYVKNYKHYQADANGNVNAYYDNRKISSYAVEPLKWAVGCGLISGNDKKELDPKGTATRAQFATILQRFGNQRFELEKYTISFASNDATGKRFYETTVQYGTPVNDPGTPSREGWIFQGWSYNGDATSTPCAFPIIATRNQTIMASWVKQDTILFNMNDGTGAVYLKATVKTGEAVSKPSDPKRNGYVFKGWYKDVEGTISYNFKSPVNGDLKLYAKWELIPESEYYTVMFDMNDGTGKVHQTISVEDGKVVTSPKEPKREGYFFDGWYQDAAGTTAFNFDTPVIDNLTLYAKWEKLYQVIFDRNDGTVVHGSKYVRPGHAVSAMEDPVRKGFVFKGWYLDSSGTNAYSFGSPVYKDFRLYAKWEPEPWLEFYTVVFEVNDGTGRIMDTQTVAEGEKAGSAIPWRKDKENYKFEGWYLEPEGINRYDFSPVYENLTLYAKWTRKN